MSRHPHSIVLLASIAALALALTASAPRAQKTWTGSVDTDWHTAGNWNPAGVPTTADDVTIPPVANAPTTAGATALCRQLTLSATSSLTIAAGSPLQAHGAVDVSGTILGTGILDVAGATGHIGTAAGSSIPNLVVSAGAHTIGPASVSTIDHRAGAGQLDFPGMLTVSGNATFSGASISGTTAAISLLDVGGNVTLQTTGLVDLPPTIRLAGDFTATTTFAPTQNQVIFVGTGNKTLNAPNVRFHGLRIDGTLNTVTTAHDVEVDDVLQFRGTRPTLTVNSPGLLDVGFVSMRSSGTMNLGSGTHVLRDGGDIAGTLQVTRPATFRITGGTAPSATVRGLGYPRVVLEADAEFSNTTSMDSLDHDAGQMTIRRNASAQVSQDATLRGAGFGVTLSGGSSLLVSGNLSIGTTNTIDRPPDLIRVGGDLTCDASFQATQGKVQFDGAAPQTLSAADSTFLDLEVLNPTTNVVATTDLRVAGDTTVNGSLTGSGSLVLAGSSRTLTGTGSIQSLEIDASGTITVASDLTLTDLRVTGGTLDLGASRTLQVQGDCTCTGGTLAGAATSTMIVTGAVSMAGTAAGASMPTIRCRGDWASNSTFAPGAGTIFLDGSGTTRLIGLPPTFDPTFFDVVIENGNREIDNDLSVGGNSLVINSGGQLTNGRPRRTRVRCIGVTVGGEVVVQGGGELSLDSDSAIVVESTGRLRMLGTVDEAARIVGTAGGGYGLTVRSGGTVEATRFEFRDMDENGIKFEVGAVPALSEGLFADGSALPNSVLLHIDGTATVDLRDLEFDNTSGTATFNVRTTTTPTINLFNYSGAFAGEGNEDDPGAFINWVSQGRTELSLFTATGGLGGIDLSFTTVREVEARLFHISRSTNPTSGFVRITGAGITPTGGPNTGASYALRDSTVTGSTRYYYRLEEERLSGQLRLLGGDTERAWTITTQNGLGLFVGPGGFATIQAALDAAPPNGSVIVTAGTYQPFTITRPARVFTAGDGPVIVDTSSGPVLVQNVSTGGGSVSMQDLEIGSASAAFGVEIRSCADVVVLDSATIRVGAAATVPSLLVDASPQIAVQSCALAGGQGFVVENASKVYLSAGAVDVLDVRTASTVTHAGVTPGSTINDGTATVTPLGGTMPRLDSPAMWRTGRVVEIELGGDPGRLWAVLVTFTGLSYADFGAFVNVDMVLLLDQLTMQALDSGVIPPGGRAVYRQPVPDDLTFTGISLPLQGFVLDLTAQPPAGRFANLRAVVIVP